MDNIEKKSFSIAPFIVILILAAIFVSPIFLKNLQLKVKATYPSPDSIILYNPATSCMLSTAQNNLSWDSTVSGSPTYYILRKLDGDITYNQIGQTPNTFYIDNTIESDKKYRYQIRAERGPDIFFSDNEVVSSKAYCQALFSPPQTSCDTDGPHIGLTWSAASGNLNAYEIFRDGASIGQTSARNFSEGPNIEGTKTYNYSIKTNWQDGTSKTDTVPATIPACPPTLTAASGCAVDTPGGPKIDLSWNNLLGIQNYQIYRKAQAEANFSLLQTLTDAFYTDYLVQSLQYTYFQGGQVSNYVKAIWLTDQKDSGQVTTNIPQCPPFLTVQSNCDEFSMRLSWTATKDATHYNIYRDGIYRDQVVGINLTSYIDYQDLSSCPGQVCSHTYYVEAITPGSTLRSNDATKNIDCTITQSPSTPILNIPTAFCSNGYSYIHLSWTPSDNVSYYVLYRDDGITLTPLQGIETSRDDQVQSSRNYTYYVEAVGRGGPSLPSNTRSITSISCTAPSASTLSYSKACQTGIPTITLSWTQTTNTESYEIWRGLSLFNLSLLTTFDKTAPEFTSRIFKDTNLSPSTIYYYKIVSKGPPGVPSTNSNIISPTTDSCNPTTPNLNNPIPLCTSGSPIVYLSWITDGANTTRYEIFRQDVGLIKTVYPTDLEFSSKNWTDNSGLLPSTLYNYRIDAVGYYVFQRTISGYKPVTTNNCSPAGAFNLTDPPNLYCQGSYPRADLSWTPSANATSYDLLRSVNNPATIPGVNSPFSDWGFGNALNFNGANYVNVGNPTNIPLTGDLTIEFWANPSNVSVARQNPICKLYYGEFCLTMETNGSLSYYHGNGSSYISFVTSNIFNNNNWVHIVITREIATRSLKLYKNGILVNSMAWSSYNPAATTQTLYFGYGYAGYFRGMLDEVRFYNRVLSATEAQQHFQAIYSNESNLIGLWHLDESSGTSASDSTNNGNYGTLVNGPAWVQNGLQWQTNYSWQARANAPGGSTLSNTTAPSQILLCAPTKPGINIQSSFCNSGVVNTTLRWSFTTNTNKYEIYRGGLLIKTVDKVADAAIFNSRTWTDTSGLTEQTNYNYYIKAIGSAGQSQSDVASNTTPSCNVPPAPQNFSANFACGSTGNSYPRVNLSWNSSTNATSYTIYRSPSSSPFPVSTALTFYADTAVTVNTNYSYYVVAYGPGGASLPSNSVPVTTGYCTPSAPSITNLTTVCESANPANTIFWSDSTVFNTFSYEIYRSSGGTPPPTPIITFASTTPEFSSKNWKDNLGLTPSTWYHYWVKAVGPAGGTFSALKGIGTLSCGLTPSAPTLNLDNLFCQDNLPYATLSWNNVSNAYSYNLYRTNPDASQSVYSTRISPLTDKGISSLSFDGSNDYVDILNSSSLSLNKFTTEAWIYPTAYNSNANIIGKRTPTNQFYVRLYGTTGRIESLVALSSGGTRNCVTPVNITAPLNQWTHIIHTYDAIDSKLYINGVLRCTNEGNSPAITGTSPLRIGAYSASSELFKGSIDDVRIYGRAISASEDSDHYNGIYKNEADLRGVWHFDEGSGTTAGDQSGNKNTGTLYNGPTWQTDSPNILKVLSLERSKDYNYRLKAFGADTESVFSNPISFTTPLCLPAKPDLVVVPKCDDDKSQLELSWQSDPNTQYFVIHKKRVGEMTETTFTTTNTFYIDKDVLADAEYEYYIDAWGQGVYTTSDLITQKASACTKDPSKPSVTAQAACYGYSSRARLNWQEDPLGYTLSFNVWRKNITLGEADFTKIESNLPATQIKYLDNLVPIQNDLRYKLEAVGQATNIFSDESNQITTLDCNNLPPNPTVLSNDPPISTGDYIGVVLYWTDAGNEEAYRLFRREIGGTWNEIIQLPPNDDPTTLVYYADSAVSGLEDNKTYEYVAVAYNKNKIYDSGNPIYSGSFSNFLQIFIPTAKPGNFTLSGAWQGKKIKLDWTVPASTPAGGSVSFKVVRSNSPAFNTTYISECQDILDLQCIDNTPTLSETFYKVIAQNNGGTTDSNIINMALPVMNWRELIPWF